MRPEPPPGRWLSSGVAPLGGQIAEGDQFSDAQLQLLVGMRRHPATGDPLGLAYPAYTAVAERIKERISALDPAPVSCRSHRVLTQKLILSGSENSTARCTAPRRARPCSRPPRAAAPRSVRH